MQFSHWGTEPDSTGVPSEQLDRIVEASVHVPDGFAVHSRIKRFHIDARLRGYKDGSIDWATAEALALGSLAIEGFNVRLIGEDTQRGTFSHRHAVFIDQNSDTPYTPLVESPYMREQLRGRLEILNSNLAEAGPLAFEYGYSLESPKNLCLWEAQFGDFYNPAQVS